MAWSKTTKVIASTVILWASVEVMYFIWYKMTKGRKTKEDSSDSVDLPVAKSPGLRWDWEKSDFTETVLLFDGNTNCSSDSLHNVDLCENVNCFHRNLSVLHDHLSKPEKSVAVCIDRLFSSPLTSFLQAAITVGVEVRIFVDDPSLPFEALQRSGAFVRSRHPEIKPYSPSKEMQQNFVVIDEKFLLTGTLKWPTPALRCNWDGIMFLSEPCIVESFLKEFNYLWDNHNIHEQFLSPPVSHPFPDTSFWKEGPYNDVIMFRTGRKACRNHLCKHTFKELQRTDKSHIRVCIYPVLSGICDLINKAEGSIDVCLHVLTIRELAHCFMRGFSRGLQVRIIVSDLKWVNQEGSLLGWLLREGVEVRRKNRGAFFPLKFIVVDRKLVLFGSVKWSNSSLCNAYGNLICTNKEGIARKMSYNFDLLWSQFAPVTWEEFEQQMSIGEYKRPT